MSEPRKRRQNAGLRNRAGSGEIPQRSNNSLNSRSKMHLNIGKGYQRQGSYDRVRKIVQEEGRTARNLVQWSVPIESEEKDRDSKERKPLVTYKSARSPSNGKSRSRSASDRNKSRDSHLKKDDGKGIMGGSRPPSQNSMGSGKKGDLRARYWAFLFDNLARAVDEIYQTCEADESVVECKEVIMMLEQCTKDFKSLIKRLNLLQAYENAEEGNKPLSLAWEVRKSSPGKGLTANQNKEHVLPSPTVSRCLNFNESTRPTTGNSWADKVKGISPKLQVPVPVASSIDTDPTDIKTLQSDDTSLNNASQDLQLTLKNAEEDDTEGWETVQGSGRRKYRNQGGSATPPTTSNIGQMIKSTGQKVMALHTHNESKDPETYISSNSKSINPRTNSRESDKENFPQIQSPDKASPLDSDPPAVAKTNEPDGRSSPILSERIGSKTEEPDDRSSPILTKRSPRSSRSPVVSRTEEPDDRSSPILSRMEEIYHHNSNQKEMKYDGENKTAREPWPRPQTNKAHDIFSSDDEKDDETEDEDLARRLDEELVSALTEEEKLASELEQEQELALESAIKEEQSYLQEIERETRRQVEVETEPETEHSENELSSTMDSSFTLSAQTLDWDMMIKEYDERQKRSWAELADEPDTRTPGRVVIMHEKLSSPSRKRSPTESWKRHEEKQQKAQELREKLLQDKAERLSTLTNKVEEVRALKEDLLSQRRDTIQQKMLRAEEKRELQLKQKVRKAKDEEAKAMEIAFINTLEAQNKRHDIIVKHQESEARLHEIVEERHRKHEEKAAKEAAVEERRKALEAERQARLLEMQEKRKQRESEFEQRQLEREKERQEAARTKECEREERIAALNAQQVAHIQELQRKIQQKQDESARRHKENLDQIREKAFEMSVRQFSAEDHSQVPKIQPYDQKKFCTVCNRLIPSEVYLSSHLQGKKHRQALRESNGGKELSKQEIEAFNVKHIADAPAEKSEHQNTTDKERQKALKKRCKKLRTRMVQRGGEYDGTLAGKQQSVVDSQHRAKLQKVVKDLQKYVNSQEKGPWPQNKVSALDRALGEVVRILDKRVPAPADQLTVRASGGFNVIMSILDTASNSNQNLPPIIPPKSLVHACTVLRLACKGCYDNCHYMLFSNKIGQLIDLLSNQLNILIPENLNVLLSSSGGNGILQLPYDPVTPALMHLIATVLQCLAKNNPTMSCSEAAAERMSASGDPYMSRANDVVSYSVSCGVIDKLHIYFNNVRGPIDQDTRAGDFLQHSLGLLTAIAKLLCRKNVGVFDQSKAEDTTQLIGTLRVTDLVGIVSLMYGMLLHCDAPARGDTTPPDLPAHTILVTTMALRLLNHIAVLDINMLQHTLGGEGTWLEFRHITSHLLWYCQHCSHEELLHEVVLCIGYFCVLNVDNQNMMHSGQAPTVLQQLCSLPFQYFSHPRLTSILFPSLIACCYNNQANCQVLEQDLSAQLLSNFIEEKLLESQQAIMTSGSASAKKSPKVPDKDSERMSLAYRLPTDEWKKAQDFFKCLGTILKVL